MSEIIEEIKEEKPFEYLCGQCGSYWFHNPPKLCSYCGNDYIEEMWDEEIY